MCANWSWKREALSWLVWPGMVAIGIVGAAIVIPIVFVVWVILQVVAKKK